MKLGDGMKGIALTSYVLDYHTLAILNLEPVPVP